MIRKIAVLILLLAAFVCIAYFLQPVKKGKGIALNVRYKRVSSWPALPKDFVLGNPTGISIDTAGNIVVFHRAGREWPLLGSMPKGTIKDKTILIIDKESGKLLTSWGDNLFIMPHGLTVDEQNNIWLTDVALHQVFKFSYDGKLLLTLGEAKIAGNDSSHFNQPTAVAVAPDGSFYVADGYGNSRIVKFSPQGKYLLEWGRRGNKEGEFNIPHGLTLDNRGQVYVADRENNRILVFDANGKFIKQFSDDSFGNMCAVAFDKTNSKLFAVDDLSFLKLKHRGSDVFVFDTAGKVQTRFGRSVLYEGPAAWYHALAIDEEENIYIADILRNTIQKFTRIEVQ